MVPVQGWKSGNAELKASSPATAPFPSNLCTANDGCAPKGEKRTDIEALRGIAILSVVAFHCRVPGMTGGFTGVDIFFVLSGYLITGLLIGEVERTSRINLPQFYSRRLRRLLPACCLMLLGTLLVGTAVMAPAELNSTARAALATSLYVSNIFFAATTGDYFGTRVASNPLLHTWSLAVEEQFYLFWPLLIMLGLVVLRSRRALTCVLIGLTVASLAYSVWLTFHESAFAFYGLPSRAWEFAAGGLTTLLPIRTLSSKPVFCLILGWGGMAALVATCLLVSPTAMFPGWIAMLPVLATVAILIAGSQHPHRGICKLLENAPLQRLGGLSYSWYLWHWPFLVFASALMPAVATAGKLLAAGAALAVAYLTNRFIENPIRFNPFLIARPTASLSIGATFTVLCLLAGLLSHRFAEQLATAPRMTELSAARDDGGRISRRDCISADDSTEVKTCSFGAAQSPVTVVLFGDSHALQWFEAVQELANAQHWKLMTMLRLGCAAVDIGGNEVGRDHGCAPWRQEAIRRIVLLAPKLVVIGNASNLLGRSDDPTLRARSGFVGEIYEGMFQTLRALSNAHVRTLLIRDTPEFPYDVTACLQRRLRHSWHWASCDMPRAAVLDSAIFEAEETATYGLPDVHLVDMTDQLCLQEMCNAMANGTVIYRDSNHLTSHFARGLAPLLAPPLLAALRSEPSKSYAGAPVTSSVTGPTQGRGPPIKR